MFDYKLPRTPDRFSDHSDVMHDAAYRHCRKCAEAARAPLLARIAELEAQLAQAQADAKRWHWRLDNPHKRLIVAHGFYRVEDDPRGWHETADAAVDAAMKESGDA